MRIFLCSLFWCNVFLPVFSQQIGEVTFEEAGITFSVPDGWAGQLLGEAFLIGHQTEPGFLLLSLHGTQSLEEMRVTAGQGVTDPANGIFLQPEGALEEISGQGIGGSFGGEIGGQAVKAYLIGLMNPYGNDLLIMSAVSDALWSDKYRKLALEVARTVRFFEATRPVGSAQGGSEAQWEERLGNTRLTYMESYSSIDYSDPSYTTGGGYSNKEVIDLCKAHYFHYYSSNSLNVTGGSGVIGSNYGNQQGEGTWDIRAESNGNKILVLSFHNGESIQYTLSYPEGKMHLNGTRYFHTWTGENAPDCY